MKLAIVIPYYNLRFFERTLRSLDNQTITDYALYIGNDASPDDPRELILSFKNLPLKKYEHFTENLGGNSLVKQWERCINLTAGEEWMVLLGDDDVVSENYVASFYEHINDVVDKGIDVIRYASRYIDQDEIVKGSVDLYTHPRIEKSTDSFYRNHHHQSRSSLSEHVFSRVSYNQHGFYDYPLAWHSDDRAWLEFSDFGSLYTINEAIVSVRLSDSSISGTAAYRATKWKARVLFYEYIIDHLQHFNSKQRRQLLIDYSIFCKMITEFDWHKFKHVSQKLFIVGDIVGVLRILKIYLKRY